MTASEAQKRASAKWRNKNYRTKTVGFRFGVDDDILEYLESKPSQQAFIKSLIREAMNKGL